MVTEVTVCCWKKLSMCKIFFLHSSSDRGSREKEQTLASYGLNFFVVAGVLNFSLLGGGNQTIGKGGKGN